MNKKYFISVLLMAMMCSCYNRTVAPVENSKDSAVVLNKETAESEETDSVSNGQGLNGIRFANFKDKDWLDNEYIHQLRLYLDGYNSGKIENAELDPYKEKVRGKFVIWKAEPFMLGGLFIQFIFVDSPNDIFSSWVYSEVDEDTKSITGYSVRGVEMEDDKSGFTKERILEIVKQEDKLKLF